MNSMVKAKLYKFQADAGSLCDKAPTAGAVLIGTVKPEQSLNKIKFMRITSIIGFHTGRKTSTGDRVTLQHDCMYLESGALSPLSVRDDLCPDLTPAMSTSSTTLESAGTLPFQGPCTHGNVFLLTPYQIPKLNMLAGLQYN
jgi:hypothetical protein